jgi:hypothetical protein
MKNTELALARRSRNQSNRVETQSAQRLGSRSQRNASVSVTSFELSALCDEKSCSENKILRVCNIEKTEPALTQKFNRTTDFPMDFADGRGFRSIQSALIRVISGNVLPSVASVASCKIRFRFGCGPAAL